MLKTQQRALLPGHVPQRLGIRVVLPHSRATQPLRPETSPSSVATPPAAVVRHQSAATCCKLRARLPGAVRRAAARGLEGCTARCNSSAGSSSGSGAVDLRPISELKGLQPSNGVVVWFKNDLRVDDHPGLLAALASGSETVVPLYVISPERLWQLAFTPGGPEVLSAALHVLRRDLRALGSDLVVRSGLWDAELERLVPELGARAVVTEQEVEYRWKAPVVRCLGDLHASGKVAPYEWQAALWPASAFENGFRSWQAKRGPPAEPLPPPSSMPPLPAGVEPGAIPSGAEMRELVQAFARSCIQTQGDAGVCSVAQQLMAACESGPEARRAVRLSGAAADTLELLRMYLSSGNGGGGASSTPPSAGASPAASLDEDIAALRSPGADGAAFTGLFATAKALGTLSVRRVYKEAFAAEGKPYGSVAPRALRRDHARTAATAAEAADFHRALAVLDDSRSIAPGVDVHFWRWRGGLTDYCVAEPPEGTPYPPGADPAAARPAILLVHGFGAFGDQWRGNLGPLAAAGFRVFAPTFPGFGRSQKASVSYSQDVWRDFLRDFIVQVVGSPVVVAGNSIGGYISSCVAADFPQLVKGLVLLNSAGPVDASFDVEAWRRAVAAGRPAPPAFIVSAISQGLFWYLERTVPSTLRWLYPTNPSKADEWLQTEILRAAGDSGAIDVFKSVWYLPAPRALNWLVKDAYGGPAMVLQGALDPLNDARGRARQLAELCPNVEVTLLDAGHCPHDEVPDQVNEGLLRFIRTRVLKPEPGTENVPAAVAASASQL